jgi:hypothetical protein
MGASSEFTLEIVRDLESLRLCELERDPATESDSELVRPCLINGAMFDRYSHRDVRAVAARRLTAAIRLVLLIRHVAVLPRNCVRLATLPLHRVSRVSDALIPSIGRD